MLAYCLLNDLNIKNASERPKSFKFEIKNSKLILHGIAKSIINKTIDITGISLENMNLKDIEKFNKR